MQELESQEGLKPYRGCDNLTYAVIQLESQEGLKRLVVVDVQRVVAWVRLESQEGLKRIIESAKKMSGVASLESQEGLKLYCHYRLRVLST